MLKPLGLTILFVAVYFGMKWLYLQTFDASKVVMYDVWPDMYFGMASFCICFPLDALLEQIVLKRKLKSEYLDYVFWDAEIKAKKDRPLRYDETKLEQYPTARWVHYMRIFICVTLGAFFIASGVESMTFFRAICVDQIYEARVDQADVILRYQDVLSIEQDPEVPEYYVVRGNAGQVIYMSDDEKLQYVAQQCGIQIPQTE